MLMFIYTVRDAKAQLYGRPFFVHNAAIALRGMSDQVNDPQSDFFKYPTDFELFELGTYDDSTAVFEIYPQPKPISTISALKKND